MTSWPKEETVTYLKRILSWLEDKKPYEIYSEIMDLVQLDDEWKKKCINMIPAENLMSPSVSKLLGTDLHHRVCVGPVGAKKIPIGGSTKYIEEIEGILIETAKKLFKSKYIEHRLRSGTETCTAIYLALMKPKDPRNVMAIPWEYGGNEANTHLGFPGRYGLSISYIPFDLKEMNVDTSAFKKIAEKLEPKMIVLGSTMMLFPYPLKEIREIADGVGAQIYYDGAHVGPLIAAHKFQDPLREGADILSVNTHKMMGGPMGSLVMTNDHELARCIEEAVYPTIVQTTDCSRLVALAVRLAEMSEFEREYAEQSLVNAKTFAEQLDSEGFEVIGKQKGYTESHQVMLDAKALGGGEYAEKKLTSANIICNKQRLPWNHNGGVRFGTQYVTKQGMKEDEMRRIVSFMRRTLIEKEDPSKVASEVAQFAKDFQKVHYCFD